MLKKNETLGTAKKDFFNALDAFCEVQNESNAKELKKQVDKLPKNFFSYNELDNIENRLQDDCTGNACSSSILLAFQDYRKKCQRQFTKGMYAATAEFAGELDSVYREADFKNALNTLKKADALEEKRERVNTLCMMFNKIEIPCEEGLEEAIEYYEGLIAKGLENGRILTSQQYEDEAVYRLFCESKKYKRPEEYMERLVNDLTRDHVVFQRDKWNEKEAKYNLSTRILKQFVKYGGPVEKRSFLGEQSYINKYAQKKYGSKALPQSGQDKNNAIADAIDNDIFEIFNIYDKVRDTVIDAVNKTVQDGKELNAKAIQDNLNLDAEIEMSVPQLLRETEKSWLSGKKEAAAKIFLKKMKELLSARAVKEAIYASIKKFDGQETITADDILEKLDYNSIIKVEVITPLVKQIESVLKNRIKERDLEAFCANVNKVKLKKYIETEKIEDEEVHVTGIIIDLYFDDTEITAENICGKAKCDDQGINDELYRIEERLLDLNENNSRNGKRPVNQKDFFIHAVRNYFKKCKEKCDERQKEATQKAKADICKAAEKLAHQQKEDINRENINANLECKSELTDEILSLIPEKEPGKITPGAFNREIEEHFKYLKNSKEKDTWRPGSAYEILESAVNKLLKAGNDITEGTILESIECDDSLKDFISKMETAIAGKLEEAKKEAPLDFFTRTIKQKFSDKVKPTGSLWLLREAYELGNGIFSVNTKKYLYHFAMIYDMTLFTNNTTIATKRDERSDVEYQLFGKYYINNVMRFYAKDKITADKLMSERGINDKNFAEECYLYYIAKPAVINSDKTGWEAWSPAYKLKRSREMIEGVTKDLNNNWYQNNQMDQNGLKNFTEYCKENRNRLLNLDEEVFKAELCQEFRKFGNAKITNPMQPGEGQNTAFSVYNKLINGITKMSEETYKELELHKKNKNLPKATGTLPLNRCNYGLWVPDISAYKNGRESLPDRRGDVDREEFRAFMNMLEEFNDMIGITFDEGEVKDEESKTHYAASIRTAKAMKVKSAKEVTRVSILAACYYYYTQYKLIEGTEELNSFEDVFYDFKGFADEFLGNAYYIKIRQDNFFDVLIVFSVYAYLFF